MNLDAEVKKLVERDAQRYLAGRGEVVIQTDTGRIRVGDGETPGGREHALRSDIIGGGGGIPADQVLQLVPQDLDLDEQRNARLNISAASIDDVQGMPWLATWKVSRPITALNATVGQPFGTDVAGPSDILTVFSQGNRSRALNSGTVAHVRASFTATVPANAKVYIECWRKQPDSWALIWRSDDVRSQIGSTAGVKTLILGSRNRPVITGDAFAVRIQFAPGSYGKHLDVLMTSGASVRAAWGDIGAGWNWETATEVPNLSVSLQVFAAYTPAIALLGADQWTGYPNSDSLISEGQLWDVTADPSVMFERICGLACRQLTQRGDTMADLLARFQADVTITFPKIVVLAASGFNDLKAGRTKEQWLADLKAIIDGCLAEDQPILCAVVSELPLYDPAATDDGMANATNNTLDLWAKDAQTLCYQYKDTAVIWVEVRDAMGQPRDPDNFTGDRWDLNDGFPASTTDGYHLSRRGSTALALAVTNALKLWVRTIYAREPERLAVRPFQYADLGDADVTLARSGYPVSVIFASTPLTANRTITLPPTKFDVRDIVLVVRTAGGPGTLTIARPAGQTPTVLKVIPAATPAAVEVMAVSVWQLTNYSVFNPATGGTATPVVKTYNVADPAVALPSDADVLVLTAPGNGWAMNATPMIAPGVFVGQRLILMGASDMVQVVEVSDESIVPGSTLILPNPPNQRDITQQRVLNLVWDGAFWIETGYNLTA